MTTTDTTAARPDLDAIQARADAARPGRWMVAARYDRDYDLYHSQIRNLSGEVAEVEGHEPQDVADAEFIAAARTDVPALAAYARHLEQLLADALAEPHPVTGEPQLGINTRHRIRVALGQVGS